MSLKTSEENAAFIYNFPFLEQISQEFLAHKLFDPNFTIEEATDNLLKKKGTLIKQDTLIEQVTTPRNNQEIGDLYFAVFNSDTEGLGVNNTEIMRLIISCSMCSTAARHIGEQILHIGRIPQYIVNVKFEVRMRNGIKEIVKEDVAIFIIPPGLFN